MPTALTFEGVWATLQETAKRIQETERIMRESSRETDRKFQETERLMKESAEETERLMKVSSEETQKEFKKMMKALGDIGNRLGEFVEEMVSPAIVRLFQERGIDVQKVYRRATARVNGEFVEIDLLAVDGTAMVAVECKSKMSMEDVTRHLKRMEKIKVAFSEYADKTLYGAVAAMVMPEEIADYACREGLFVLAQSGNTLAVRNEKLFQPKTW